MRLVYLDSSHLVLLEKALKAGASDSERFAQRLRTGDFILALGFPHFAEMARSEFAESRGLRFEALKRLAPIRCDLPMNEAMLKAGLVNVQAREIFVAILRNGNREPPALSDLGFPRILDERDVEELGQTFERDDLRQAFLTVEAVVSTWCRIVNQSPPGGAAVTKLRDLPGTLPAGVGAEDVLQNIDGLTDRSLRALNEADPEQNELFERIAPGESETIRQEARAGLDELFREMVALGPRGAMAEKLRVDASDKAVLRQSVEELQARSALKEHVLRLLAQLCPTVDTTFAHWLAGQIQLEDCPGRWLSFQVGQEIRRAESSAKAGNEYDVWHLTYLPYVDLFFADKRIARYTEQVRQRHPEFRFWPQLSRPIAVEQSLDALISAFERESDTL